MILTIGEPSGIGQPNQAGLQDQDSKKIHFRAVS